MEQILQSTLNKLEDLKITKTKDNKQINFPTSSISSSNTHSHNNPSSGSNEVLASKLSQLKSRTFKILNFYSELTIKNNYIKK